MPEFYVIAKFEIYLINLFNFMMVELIEFIQLTLTIACLFGFILLTSLYGKKYFLGKEIGFKSNYGVQKMSKTMCLIGFIFSFLPGISLLGHLSGFIAGCFLFLI